ncbi:energy transducer TonB [Shewanella sp. SM101]|uniref:energy transducer TonB n=1 Tax=Shewanella sp. SM101 TaxID=2912789 RepID=UPI0021DA8475|nr:energy transducer TonB [Shewanella sp. SM101]MCU8103892.1 energy transducer TonB [Shewanella sp. SM101]
MTPKRYLAFGALTVAIQTGVIASQPAMTMQPSAQSSSVNQASLTPSANTVTLNFSTATSATSNTSAEPIKQTDAKVATVNSTAQKVSTAESVDKAVIPKTKADQRIDSQLAKKSSATKPTANNHPNTDPLATNALEPSALNSSALNPSALAHKRLEQVEQQTEPKTAQMDLITNAAEVDAKATPNVASATADSAQTNIVELAKPLFAAAPPQPTYPKIARKKGLEGTATIEVMFNELGEQLALTLVKSSGFSLLDQTALDAVENWQFAAPAQRLASHYKVRVPIRFALN